MELPEISLILNKIISNRKCSKKDLDYIEKEILSSFTLYGNDIEERDGIKILKFYNKYFARIKIDEPNKIEGFSSFTKCLSSNFWTQLNIKVFNLENDNNKSSSKIKKTINNQSKKTKLLDQILRKVDLITK